MKDEFHWHGVAKFPGFVGDQHCPICWAGREADLPFEVECECGHTRQRHPFGKACYVGECGGKCQRLRPKNWWSEALN